MTPQPPAAWAHLPFFATHWPDLAARLGDCPGWMPGPGAVFRALELTSPQQTRVVLLGQDPYPTPGDADGLAFSTQGALPRSLHNIFVEMESDLGAAPTSGDLSGWARQGVLMLNTSLSVMPQSAGAHAAWGWDKLTREAVEEAMRWGPLAFILWGKHAQTALKGMPRAQDLVIATPHPSPLSARRGFFGSRPFTQVNDWLEAHRPPAIDWLAASG